MSFMSLKISDLDKSFLSAFENATLDVMAFHHREHLRLAYILLVIDDVKTAHLKARAGLQRLLQHNAISSEYHETLTLAWMQAVKHFMFLTQSASSSEHFIEQNQILLDKQIMFTHYSRSVIEGEKSRNEYIPPDLEPIPSH